MSHLLNHPPGSLPAPSNHVSSGSADRTLAEQSTTSSSTSLAGLAIGIALFLLALAPRLVGLGTYVTTDELFWLGRTGAFAAALADRNLAATFQTGHPGVTTMWLGVLSLGVDAARPYAANRATVSRSAVSRAPDFLTDLTDARRGVAIASALLIGLAAFLTWRLAGAGPALLGGALVAFDPFYLAHSQLLHLDALQSGFMLVALLAGLVRWRRDGGSGYLLLSAVATGLALLTKIPAVFLAVFIPLLALSTAASDRHLRIFSAWRALLTWGGLTLLTCVVLWPAIWAAPVTTVRGLVSFADSNSRLEALAALAPSPNTALGPLFYPFVFLIRTTPLTLLGLVVSTGLSLAHLTTGRREAARSRWPLDLVLILTAYALLYATAMTLAAKGFDRYLLPAFPVLDLLAGLGLARLAGRLNWAGGAGQLLAGAFLLPALVYPLATSLPYPLAWYNPLAGGGSAAQRAIPVGWGEGLDQVATFLNGRPDPERLKVAMRDEVYTTVLDAQFVGTVMPIEGGDPSVNDATYLVRYIRAPLDWPPLYDSRFQTWPPEQVVRIAGIEYAQVYAADQGIPIGADFAGLAQLQGYGLDQLVQRPGRAIKAHLFWRTAASDLPDLRVRLTLTEMTGRVITDSGGPLDCTVARRISGGFYQLIIPPDLPPGEYLLWAGLDRAGPPLQLASRPAALAPGAPEAPDRAVLRSIIVR